MPWWVIRQTRGFSWAVCLEEWHYRALTSQGIILGLPESWLPGEWSGCSKSCAGGQQSRKIQCVQKKPFQKEEAVLHSLCPVSTPTQVQVCNSHPCPPEWSPGPWSQVPKHHFRSMVCMKNQGGGNIRDFATWELLSSVHVQSELMSQCLGVVISASTFGMVLMWPEVLNLLYQSLDYSLSGPEISMETIWGSLWMQLERDWDVVLATKRLIHG